MNTLKLMWAMLRMSSKAKRKMIEKIDKYAKRVDMYEHIRKQGYEHEKAYKAVAQLS